MITGMQENCQNVDEPMYIHVYSIIMTNTFLLDIWQYFILISP